MTCIFTTDDDATRWALEWLRVRGFASVKSDGLVWLRLRELRNIYGIKPPTLHKRLHHAGCPPTPRQFGPEGKQLVRVAMSKELDAWLKKPLQKGVAL